MPRAHANGVELEYETVGDPAGRPLLLVQGLGAQLISVEDGLCRERFVERAVANARAISSGTAYPFDEEAVRHGAARGYDRADHPKGTGRQFAAILAAGDRAPALGQIQVPTVVVHGTEDKVIGISGGEATAAAIPGARLLRIPGLGHELPPGFWPTLTDLLEGNADRADGG